MNITLTHPGSIASGVHLVNTPDFSMNRLYYVSACVLACALYNGMSADAPATLMSTTQSPVTNRANLTILSITGPEARAYSHAIATLRTTQFREFPYLYESSPTDATELDYLEHYFACPDALILLVFDGEALVGVASGLPLIKEGTESLSDACVAAGCSPEKTLYVGEVVFGPTYRGKGHAREWHSRLIEHAEAKGFSHIALVTVIRSATDPRTPAGYTPLDAMLERAGYDRGPQTMSWSWKQTSVIPSEVVLETGETPNSLTFWSASLEKLKTVLNTTPSAGSNIESYMKKSGSPRPTAS